MSNFPSYPTRSFSETQKFFVLDPQTGTPSFVLGSDLVNQLTPNSNYVFAESTRATAQATDYQVGQLIQTAGSATAGDGLASGYLVVPSGDGDFPMDNGNELLVISGDDALREQLISNASGEGSDLVAHTGTTDTVTGALNQRVIYVESVADLRASSDLFGDVHIQGYYGKNTGGGGHVYLDETDTTSTDDGGSVFVDSVGNRWKRPDGTLYPSDFGAVHDGVTDDLDPHQRHANWALGNNKSIEYEAVQSYLSGSINLTDEADPRAITVQGAGMGDQYNTIGVSQSGSETLFETPGTDLFFITVSHRTNSLSFTKLRLRSNNTKSGYILNISADGDDHQVKQVVLEELCYLEAGGLFRFTTTLASRNGPYMNISKCFGYQGSAAVYLGDNVGTTIFSMSNCLFHSNDQGIRIGRGGVYSLKDVWFEACGNAIEKTSDFVCTLSLDHVYFELCTASIVPRKNTSVVIQGGTNLPGAFMDGSTLNMGGPTNSIANYSVPTNPMITMTGNGVRVKTPSTIVPFEGSQSIFNVALEDLLISSSRSEMVMGNTINGTDGTGALYSTIPASKNQSRFAITKSPYPYRGLVYSDTSAEDRLICAAFMYNSSALLNGLSASSKFVIDGIDENLSAASTFPQELNREYMCFAFAPLPANSSFDSAEIELASSVNYASIAQVSVGPATKCPINGFVDYSLRVRKEVAEIGASGSKTFAVVSEFQAPYFVKARIIVDEGTQGFYEITSSGTAENGTKIRSESDNTSANIAVSAVDGAQSDILNVTVTNNTAASVGVEFLWEI